MKHYVILILAICGFAIADATLTDDINDFVDLFPTDSTISDIIIAYMKSDEKIKTAIEHVQSSGPESYLESLTNLPEFEALENFIKDAGLEPSVAINAMSRILGMSNLEIAWSNPEKSSEVIISGGFEGFIGDVLAAFPAESIGVLREKKLISSKFFVSFVEKITSQEFQERLTALQATEEYRELFKLLSPRVNLFDFVNLFASAIGLGSDGVAYNAAPGPFHESMNDFIELSSSSDDMAEFGEKYSKVGSKIPDIIRSLKSDEFTGLFDSLKNTEEYLALEKSFEEAGIDLKSLYRKLYQTFVQLALSNDAYSDFDTNVPIIEGLREFLEDYRNRKATEEITDLHREKRDSSAAFDALVERTKSDDLIALHDALTAKEQSRKIKEALISLRASENDYASLFGQLIDIYTKKSD